jgi:hypothetical protein
MDISKLAKKPELIEVVLDDEDIVKEYSEPVVFYIYDSVDLHTYFDFYKVQQDQDGTKLTSLMRDLIKTAEGKPAVKADEMLPIDITMAALIKINELLGKSKPKSLTEETGKQ